MNADEIRALGQDIIMPICVFAFMAWMVYRSGRDE
jgi:hypothetical protein